MLNFKIDESESLGRFIIVSNEKESVCIITQDRNIHFQKYYDNEIVLTGEELHEIATKANHFELYFKRIREKELKGV